MNSKEFSNNEFLPNLTFLKEMLGDDEEGLKEILAVFVEEAPRMLNSLEESAKEKDYENVKRVSHTLITELSTVGINSVVNDLKRINKGAKEMEDLQEVIGKVVDVVRHSMEYFKKII